MKRIALFLLAFTFLGVPCDAQVTNYDRQGGEVLLRKAKQKPYAEFRDDKMLYFRAEDLEEFMDLYKDSHGGADRMVKMPFAGISKVDFVSPNKDEMRLLKGADACRDVNSSTICFMRKANVLLRDGKKYDGVLIYTDYTGPLYGPDGEEYNLKDLDIVGFTRNN